MEMKKIGFVIILLLPLTLFCETTDSSKVSKLEIGITYSPDYCYRKLKPDAGSKWIADIRDTIEIGKLGYTTGLNVVYNISKKISIGTGILFSDKGEKTKKTFLGNSLSGSLPINNKFIYHYLYIDIPVKANYTILNGKFKLFLTAGISTNIFLGQKTTSILYYGNRDSEKRKTNVSSDFSKINFAYIVGFGIDYPVTDKLNFKLEPLFRHSINSVIKAPIKSYLYSTGVNIGIYFKL